MRIWDVPPEELCRKHLLGEHRELHGLWNILTLGKRGYSQHPETKRWVGRTRALYTRHTRLVMEMKRRGYNHASELHIEGELDGPHFNMRRVNSEAEQVKLLKDKPCDCYNTRG